MLNFFIKVNVVNNRDENIDLQKIEI